MADSLYLDQIPVDTSPQLTDKLVGVRGSGVGSERLIPIGNLPLGSVSASGINFTPAVSANWATQPTTVQQALDTVSIPITATGVLAILKYAYITTSTDYVLNGSDVVVMYTGTGGNTLTLPDPSLSKYQNKIYFVMNDGTGAVTVSGTIYRNGTTLTSLTLSPGDCYTLVAAYPVGLPRWRVI